MFCHTGANPHPEESKVIVHTNFGSKVVTELSFNQQTKRMHLVRKKSGSP